MALEDVVAAQTKELSDLVQVLKGSSGYGRGDEGGSFDFKSFSSSMNESAKQVGRETMLRKRQEESYKKVTEGILGSVHAMKKLNDGMNDYTRQTDLAGRLMSDMVETLDSKDLDKAAQELKKNLSQSSNAWAREMAENVNTGEDLIRVQRLLADDGIAKFKEAQKLDRTDAKQRKQAIKITQELGIELEDLDREAHEVNGAFSEVSMSAAKTADTMGTSSDGLKSKLAALGTALAAITNRVYELGVSAATTGTQMEYFDALMMGMSPEELNLLQKDYRQTMMASKDSMNIFNDTVEAGTKANILNTGTLEAGIRINAQSYRMAKLFGENQKDYIKTQTDLFNKLHAGMNMTAEEFMELREELMNNSNVQSRMFRLNMQQRNQMLQELMLTKDRLHTLGLTEEQSKRVLDVFTEMGAKSPKERMKEAAKMQAVMGAMGMGEDAARAGELMRQGKTGTADFANIMAKAQDQVSNRMQQGFASEMMTMQMIQTAGLEQYLGPNSPLNSLTLQQGARIDESYKEEQSQTSLLEKQLGAFSGLAKVFMVGMDRIKAVLSDGVVGALITLMGLWTGGKIIGMLTKGMTGSLGTLLGKLTGGMGTFASAVKGAGGWLASMGTKAASLGGGILSGAKTLATGAATGLGKAAAGVTATGTGAVLAAGAAGYGIGTLIDQGLRKYMPDVHEEMSDAVGGTIAQMLDRGWGVFGDAVDFWGDKIFGEDEDEKAAQQEQVEQQKEINDNLKDLGTIFREESARATEEARKQTEEIRKTKESVDKQTEVVEEGNNEKDKDTRRLWIRKNSKTQG